MVNLNIMSNISRYHRTNVDIKTVNKKKFSLQNIQN